MMKCVDNVGKNCPWEERVRGSQEEVRDRSMVLCLPHSFLGQSERESMENEENQIALGESPLPVRA